MSVILTKIVTGIESKIPPFVIFTPPVCCHVVLALKILCALNAMVQAETWFFFFGDKRLQLCKPLGAADVGMDLIEVAVEFWVS